MPPEYLGYRSRKGKMLGKGRYIDYSVGCRRGAMMRRTLKKNAEYALKVRRENGEFVDHHRHYGQADWSRLILAHTSADNTAVLSATIDDHSSRKLGPTPKPVYPAKIAAPTYFVPITTHADFLEPKKQRPIYLGYV